MKYKEEQFSEEELKEFKKHTKTFDWFLMYRVIENIPLNTYYIKDTSDDCDRRNFLLKCPGNKTNLIKPKYKIGDIIAIKENEDIIAYGKITSIHTKSAVDAIHGFNGILSTREFNSIKPSDKYNVYNSELWIYHLNLLKECNK